MRTRVVILVTLLAVGIIGFGAGAGLATKPPAKRVITEGSSGKTFTLGSTSSAVLRLGNRWTWSQPKVRGGAVVLVPVNYERNPGYREWKISRKASGTARITASGKPNCDGCKRSARSFSVKLTVR